MSLTPVEFESEAAADAVAFARLISRLLSPAFDAEGESELARSFETAFADLYSKSAGRRASVIDALIRATGSSSPDQVDLLGHLTQQVLQRRPDREEALRRLPAALKLLREL